MENCNNQLNFVSVKMENQNLSGQSTVLLECFHRFLEQGVQVYYIVF